MMEDKRGSHHHLFDDAEGLRGSKEKEGIETVGNRLVRRGETH
jgi:hypothetical protein